MNHYFEYGGGLGDVFMQMYEGRSYNVLAGMAPGDSAEVIVCCHNPHVVELFTHHPRREQMRVRAVPYHPPAEADVARAELGLCRIEDRPRNPDQVALAPISFFPPENERAVLNRIMEEPFLVLSASAGEPSRNIPPAILRKIADVLAAQRVRVIAVGRNYVRRDRFEQAVPEFPGLMNMIDQLSVPAVAQLVQGCAGTINGHSAVGMLGWLERKPQFLLLDEGAWARHFKHKDAWAFGADFATTTWACFEQFDAVHLERFLESVKFPLVACGAER